MPRPARACVIFLPLMFRRAASALAFAVFVCSANSQTENKAPAIRVNVDLISVSVRVTDKQDHDVSGLTADDFALFEDGRKQKIPPVPPLFSPLPKAALGLVARYRPRFHCRLCPSKFKSDSLTLTTISIPSGSESRPSSPPHSLAFIQQFRRHAP
jgi:hypothetical protein